jgi:DNA primase
VAPETGASSTASATDSSSRSPAPTRQPATLEPLGFVGRRHPDLAGKDAGPKYLNTPDTVLFHKGAQLHIVREDLLEEGATPVLVEGPMDALAVSIAGRGDYVGLAPLGTSLTEEQAGQLARLPTPTTARPVVATDADLAGQIAAQRDYWLLAQHGLTRKRWPDATRQRPGRPPRPQRDGCRA